MKGDDMEQISGTVKAWITNEWVNTQDIKELAADGHNDKALDKMSYSAHDMTGVAGWIEVGTAEVTVTFIDEDSIKLKLVEGLNKQIQDVQAEAEMKVRGIKEKIHNLMAITYSPAEAAE